MAYTFCPVRQGPAPVWLDRLVAVLVIGAAAVIAAKMWSVTPDPRGHGTHEQFGMTPCSWPQLYGVPCPTCGCTTAAVLVVHGRVLAGLWTQPFGALVAVVGLSVAGLATFVLLRGHSLLDLYARVPWLRVWLGVAVLLLLGWGWTWLFWAGR